jgi:hypothetical protein
VRQSPKLWTCLLVLVLTASVSMTAGCHFHRYHDGYTIQDELESHPRYGSHHN